MHGGSKRPDQFVTLQQRLGTSDALSECSRDSGSALCHPARTSSGPTAATASLCDPAERRGLDLNLTR